MNMLYALLDWIAVALIICAGFLYLMVTTPVDEDEDEDAEEAELRVRNSMRGTL